MSALVVIGGGEHSRVLIDAARSAGWSLVGFIDSAGDAPAARSGVPWLGDDDRALAHASAEWAFVVGIAGVGISPLRRRLVERYDRARVRWATLVHDRAVVSSTAHLAQGVVVFAGAVINAGAKVKDHAIVNTAAVIEHDVELGAFCHVGPAAAIGGGALIGEETYVGLGSRLRDHIRVGRGVTVGMGAVVVGDVPDGQTVLGVPARERSR